MNNQVDKKKDNKRQSVSYSKPQIQTLGKSTSQSLDSRPELITQMKLQEISNNSPQVDKLSYLQDIADNRIIEKTEIFQRKPDEEFIQKQLGNTFSAPKPDEDQKKFREDDTNKRLKDPKMIACHLDEIAVDGATWDFKHWMVEGEMPPIYGFGFTIREYFKNLEPEDRKNFRDKAKSMRSATVITKTIESYPKEWTNFLKGFDVEKQEILIKVKELKEESQKDDKMEFADETLGYLFSTDKFKLGCSIIKALVNDPAGGAKLLAMGNQIWQIVAQSTKMSEVENKQWKVTAKKVGDFFMDLGREFQNKRDSKELGKDQYEPLKYNLGLIARSWGNATAALGADPWGKKLTDSISSVVADYDDFDGKDFVKKKKEETEKAGGNAWSDMDISESMWDKGANFDRYRDTNVHIMVPKEEGADIANPNKSDKANLRVTHAELQLGNDWDVSRIDEDQDLKVSKLINRFENQENGPERKWETHTGKDAKKEALDFIPGYSKGTGEWPQEWDEKYGPLNIDANPNREKREEVKLGKDGKPIRDNMGLQDTRTMADGSTVNNYGAQRGGQMTDKLSKVINAKKAAKALKEKKGVSSYYEKD